MRRGILCVLILAVVFWWVWAAERGAGAAPTLDDQVYAIAAALMCPVCGGQTVAESDSQLAEQMRAIIRQRLRAGQTREEIIAYFVGQFGEGVLAAPPPRGGGLAVWLVPPVTVGIGLFVLRRLVGRSRPPGAPAPAPPTAAEVEQIRRDVRELD